jgi:TatD DNase family protein
MRLFDTHCHLQDTRIESRIAGIVDRAREAGVVRMLCCGTKEQDWDAVKRLSERFPEIVPAFGLHPWYIRERTGSWLERLEKLLREAPSAAVGEIGLDHAVENRDDKDQNAVFLAQLKLARKLERPVSLHCRKAWGTLIDILQKQCGTPDGGAVHSYSGPPDLVPRLQSMNVSLSFSGSVVHDRNRRGRLSLAAVSEEFLLVETDSPDIPLPGVEPGANEPAFCDIIVR